MWGDNYEEIKYIDDQRNEGKDTDGTEFSTGKFSKPEPKSLRSRVFGRSTPKNGGKRRTKCKTKRRNRRRRVTRFNVMNG
jgi:hypothetical protein